MALSRAAPFEGNYFGIVFVVHKTKGLLLKRIRGASLRYEVPIGVVSDYDYATAGKFALPHLIASCLTCAHY